MSGSILLIIIGFCIGTLGTLIGVGGGIILMPFLILNYPDLPPEIITAISVAVIAINSISGSFAYSRSGLIDYKAGGLFALFAIPGSILGVLSVPFVPQQHFNFIFGIILLCMGIFLWYKNSKNNIQFVVKMPDSNLKETVLIDKTGNLYRYAYNTKIGVFISAFVGYIAPILGIGGGIIHVPAMHNILRFPIKVATATSHFILAIMATTSVLVNFFQDNYQNDNHLKLIVFVAIGVIPGAQLGAFLSHKIAGKTISKILTICLILVGIRILTKNYHF